MKKIIPFPEGNVLPHMHDAVDASAKAAIASRKALISGAETAGHLVAAVRGTVETILFAGKAGVGMVKNVFKGKTEKALHKKKKHERYGTEDDQLPMAS